MSVVIDQGAINFQSFLLVLFTVLLELCCMRIRDKCLLTGSAARLKDEPDPKLKRGSLNVFMKNICAKIRAIRNSSQFLTC